MITISEAQQRLVDIRQRQAQLIAEINLLQGQIQVYESLLSSTIEATHADPESPGIESGQSSAQQSL